jgi:hypothetical protein
MNSANCELNRARRQIAVGQRFTGGTSSSTAYRRLKFLPFCTLEYALLTRSVPLARPNKREMFGYKMVVKCLGCSPYGVDFDFSPH